MAPSRFDVTRRCTYLPIALHLLHSGESQRILTDWNGERDFKNVERSAPDFEYILVGNYPSTANDDDAVAKSLDFG